MPDLLTIFVIPLIVAVFALVVEYWIIQPIRSSQESKAKHQNNAELTVPQNIARATTTLDWARSILLLSGLISFFVAIIAVLGGFRVGQLSFAGHPLHLPSTDLFRDTLLSDANVSLAAIIYTSLAFITVTSNSQLPLWTKIFFIFVLPPILLILWSGAFFHDNWIVFLLCIAISNLWMALGVVPQDTYVNRDDYMFHGVIVGVLLFPANALALVFVAKFSPLAGWLCAVAILVAQLVILYKMEDWFA